MHSITPDDRCPPCPRCGSTVMLLDGIGRGGTQNHMCRDCGRQFRALPRRGPVGDEERRLVERMLLERPDIRAIARCGEAGCGDGKLIELLRPTEDDYFVLKPKYSAFFSTTLDTLLRYPGTRTLVIGGFAADICVLFTANDAYMRDLKVVVPSDGVAANEAEDSDAALALMKRVLKASSPLTLEIDFAALSAVCG